MVELEVTTNQVQLQLMNQSVILQSTTENTKELGVTALNLLKEIISLEKELCGK